MKGRAKTASFETNAPDIEYLIVITNGVTFSVRAKTPHLAIASARAGNVIGGGDWSADRIIPAAMQALAAGVPIQVRSPEATRPWQHVLEPLGAYLLLAERLAAADGIDSPCVGAFDLDRALSPTAACVS